MRLIFRTRAVFAESVPALSNMVSLVLSLMLILSTATTYGCVAYKFSGDHLPLAEHEARRAIFESLVLGVQRPSEKAQSYDLEKFIENLKKSQIFRAVEYVDKLSATDLILRSFFQKGTSPYQACLLGFEGQLLTMATGGLLPQICKADYEVSFDLYSPKNEQQRKTISFEYQTRSIMGWLAVFYLPSSRWSAKPLEDEYPTLLKSVFYRQADDIQQLLK